MSIGKLERLPLRQVWKHEALDFTTWLEDNVDVLSEVLDFNLSGAEREKAAGKFSVDLVGEDDNGNTVVIENQLERSDHDHLGKVITYLSSLEAKAAVWIVARPRPEHIKAITWLNEATSTPFYLIQVEAIRIGDSEPAPLLTKIVGPSEEAREAFKTRQNFSERHEIRRRFWTQLLDHAKAKSKLHSRTSPGDYNWVGTSAGKGLGWNYAVRQHETQVELYIDQGDAEENGKILTNLIQDKEAIETQFTEPLEWEYLEGKRACRIKYQIDAGGWRDEEKWPAVIEKTVDAMVRFEGALHNPVKKLKR